MMSSSEWSRSRFWHAYFLQNRHDRPKVTAQASASDGSTGDVAADGSAAFAGILAERSTNPSWLVAAAWRRNPGDPAFIQSLRLLLRERQYHTKVVRGCFFQVTDSADVGRLIAPGRFLGTRYTLAAVMLRNLIDCSLLDAAIRKSDDTAIRPLWHALLHDRRHHHAFLQEWLTVAFADFNFVRRNLRRVRLRVLFELELSLAVHRVAATGAMDRPALATWKRDCRKSFVDSLEAMVPYRRARMLAALVNQCENPYGKPRIG